jgi:hypothetical protein
MLKKENFLIFLCNRANNSHDEKNKKGAFHMKQLIILLTILCCIISCYKKYDIKPEIAKGTPLFDLDEDNVPNDKDECPSTPAGVTVTNNGCADEDGDGIQDLNDKCKGTPKDAKINKFGCSDSDDDGVSDNIDECPSTATDVQVNHLGCPDEDGDGIKNSIDKCNSTPKNALVNDYGCQDNDQDGVPDNIDECPNTASNSLVTPTGCFDKDQDGIKDSIDKCLQTPQGYTVNSYGCSDRDNDGVPYNLDKCPKTPISFAVDEHGCQLVLHIKESLIDTDPLYITSTVNKNCVLSNSNNCMSFSNDGHYFAFIEYSGWNNKYVRVLDIASMKIIASFHDTEHIYSIQFSSNNEFLLVCKSNSIFIINVSTWKKSTVIKSSCCDHMVLSPKGNYIAGYNSSNLYIYAKTGEHLTTIENIKYNSGYHIVFSYDETVLSTGMNIYEVGIWDVVAKVEGVPAGFTPDNRYYISSSHMYEMGSWRIVSNYGANMISSDGRYLVINHQRHNRWHSKIFEMGTWKQISQIEKSTIISFSDKWIFCKTEDNNLIKLDKSNLDIYYLYSGLNRLNYKLQANHLNASYNRIESDFYQKFIVIDRKKIQDLSNLSNAEKDEFETQYEYKKRMVKRESKERNIKELFEKNRNIIRRERVNKRMKLVDQYNKKLNNLLIASRKPIDNLKVSFKDYRADGKYFPVYISHNNVIPFNGIVRVSRANARTFKKSIDQLTVRAEVQPTINNRKKLVNIVIHNPNTGNSYYLAKTESYKNKHIQIPPNLKATVTFNEPSGNNALDAEETGNIVVEIQNNGKGSAFQVATRLVASSAIRDLDYPSEKIIPEISPTSTQQVIFPLKSGLDIPEQKALFTVEFDEKNGFPPDPVRIKFQTRQLLQPKLEIVDYIIDDSSKDGKIQQEEVVKTTFRIQNRGQGTAREVIAKVTFGPNVFQALNVPMEYDIGSVKPNDIKEFKVAFYTNQRIKNKLPLTVELFEERPRFNFSKPFAFKMNVKEKTVFETVVKAKAQKIIQITDITSPSDIDRNIPKTGISVQGVAVVIGNYDYQKVPKVEFARRDAAIMAEYLKQVFGFPSENVITIQDATLANMIDVFGSKGMATKSKISNYFSKGDEIFIYYTGHGAPGLRDKKGYLVPVDANPDNIETTGYSLETLYSNLDQINARKKTIVIDACFSGESQSGSLFKNASPMYIKADLGHLTNGTIITSSSGKQMASWYPEKRHSIFTYFFLKGVKNSAAKNEPITYKQLQQYVSGAVNKISKKLYSRIQEPQFSGNLSQEVFNIKTSDQ